VFCALTSQNSYGILRILQVNIFGTKSNWCRTALRSKALATRLPCRKFPPGRYWCRSRMRHSWFSQTPIHPPPAPSSREIVSLLLPFGEWRRSLRSHTPNPSLGRRRGVSDTLRSGFQRVRSSMHGAGASMPPTCLLAFCFTRNTYVQQVANHQTDPTRGPARALLLAASTAQWTLRSTCGARARSAAG